MRDEMTEKSPLDFKKTIFNHLLSSCCNDRRHWMETSSQIGIPRWSKQSLWVFVLSEIIYHMITTMTTPYHQFMYSVDSGRFNHRPAASH